LTLERLDIPESSLYYNTVVDASLGVPSEIYDESSGKEAIQKAKEIITWIKKNLQEKLKNF